MEYRKLPKGEEQISVLGLGNSSLGAAGHEEAVKTVAMALEHGINYFDMAAGDAKPFSAFGEAAAGCRDKIYYQIHFGADYTTGKYGWTLDLEKIKRSVDWQLKALKTDYIDFGFIHCIDELFFSEYVYVEVVCTLVKVTVQNVDKVCYLFALFVTERVGVDCLGIRNTVQSILIRKLCNRVK